MTLREVYRIGTEKLAAAGIEESSLDAWYLLEHVTGISRVSFLADSAKVMEDDVKEQYLELIERRAKRIPLQHITGVQEFMGLEFKVNEHVLIPRQDTEILVETALEELGKRLRFHTVQSPSGKNTQDGDASIRILDMCTGSGCILLSTLYYAKQETEKCGLSAQSRLQKMNRETTYGQTEPTGVLDKGSVTITGLGIDISSAALCVAKQNGENLHIEADWIESDLFTGIVGAFDMILSNPPYIPSAVIETLQPEVREHDPRLALDGKEDGLYFYRRIIEESREYLNFGGHLIFEIGAEQGEAVSSYMRECGYTEVTVKKDLAGLDRVVSGMYHNVYQKGIP